MRQLKINKSITDRSSASFNKYLTDVASYPLISVEREIELVELIKNGDLKASEELVKANLRFVVSVAKQYQNQGLSLPDLINEGNIGLMKSVPRFDSQRGFKFISYAVWWIRQQILQAIAEGGREIRLPLNKIGILTKIHKASSELEQVLERKPSPIELSEFIKNSNNTLDLDVKGISELIMSGSRMSSLDASIGDDESDGLTLIDLLSSDNKAPMIENDLKIEISRAISTLQSREREVLILFYGLNEKSPMTLEEIGGYYDLTRERVRQIKEKAIRRMKHHSRSKLLKEYI